MLLSQITTIHHYRRRYATQIPSFRAAKQTRLYPLPKEGNWEKTSSSADAIQQGKNSKNAVLKG